MTHTELLLDAADGRCAVHTFCPEGSGPFPGVIMYMDAAGIRPALLEIAERIAAAGYFVLLPDLFYRVEFDTTLGMKIFSDPVYRQDLFTRIIPTASSANVMRDTERFLAFLDSHSAVRSARIGITGYCMGGRLAVYAAGHFGERVAAAAAYHPGGLATDAPDSPHRLASAIRGRVYVAGAMKDASFDDAQKERLQKALSDAGVEHTIETYEALHGWVPRDTPVHDEAATAKHWETLLSLFGDTLARADA